MKTITFNGANDLTMWFLGYIKGVFKGLVDGEFRNEFDKVTDHCKIGFMIQKEGISALVDTIDDIRGPITKRLLKSVITEQIMRDSYNEMLMNYAFNVDDKGILHLISLELRVYPNRVNREITSYIQDLEAFKRYLELVIRHEIGHMIEMIQFDGLPVQHYDSLMKEYRDNYEKYCKEREDSTEKPFDKYARKYHELPRESLANTLGKVGPDELSTMIEYLDYILPTKKNVTIEIRVSENEEESDSNND